MKKIITILAAVTLITACKKEKDPEPTPDPVPSPPSIYVKVDGVEKKCNSCFSSSNSGGLKGAYFYLSGINEEIYFDFTPLPALGTHALVKYGQPRIIYIKNNTYYNASVGTVNFTRLDTSQNGVVNKITATFSFKTDTSSSGQFFNITEGSVNIQ